MPHTLDIPAIRQQFPALQREIDGQPVVHLDGPAGSQVPTSVADAVTRHLLHANANTHGRFATSRESQEVLDEARRAAADLVGTSDPSEIVWGPNMTSLTLAISRSLANEWKPGDVIVVTRLDHDANVAPWVLAANDAGAEVRTAAIDPTDCTLDLDDLSRVLDGRVRLVAVTAASNASGTVTPISRIAEMAHGAGAELFVDAVHYAPHRLIDAAAMGADYLACSVYKFFGPHVGLLWGKRDRMQSLRAYQVRPAGDAMPSRYETGTQNHEGIAGTLAAIDYLAGLTPTEGDRRTRLRAAYDAIGRHETDLCDRLLAGLAEIPAIRVWGITDPTRAAERVPTVSITHERHTPSELAATLGDRGIFVWSGNYYALELSQTLGREPEGMVRLGLLHYNTAAEVDRTLEALAAL